VACVWWRTTNADASRGKSTAQPDRMGLGDEEGISKANLSAYPHIKQLNQEWKDREKKRLTSRGPRRKSTIIVEQDKVRQIARLSISTYSASMQLSTETKGTGDIEWSIRPNPITLQHRPGNTTTGRITEPSGPDYTK